mgnify:CR=1 FL=1
MRKRLLPEKEICQAYIEGKNSNLIAKEFGCWPHNILKILKNNGIDRRSGSEIRKKYLLNEDYFNSIDCERKAYLLGFLCADGCVIAKNHRNCGGFSLFLHPKDVEIIEFLIEEIFITKKTINKSNKGLLGVRAYSEKIFNDLTRLGCVPNKTLSLNFPSEETVPIEYLNHFIRGYFDGDGCITGKGYKATCSFNGSKSFILDLQKYLSSLGVVSCLTDQNKYNKNCFTIASSSKNAIKFLYNFFYRDATIFLKRKKSKFEERIGSFLS